MFGSDYAFLINHILFSDIEDSQLTTDNYKHFFGARLARENNIVSTCAFRMPNFEKPLVNVFAKCYNISQNDVQPAFLTYNYEDIVPEKEIYKYKTYSEKYKWGLVAYMGSEILRTNGKFVFNTPIARHKQSAAGAKECSNQDDFCFGKNERMSGSIASYDGSSYKIGKQ